MRKNPALFIVYLIVALYILNLGLVFFAIPESLEFLNKWFLVVGAALIGIASFKWLRDRYY